MTHYDQREALHATRGGKREGAGRPPNYDEPMERSELILPKSVKQKAVNAAKKKGQSFNQFMTNLIIHNVK